MKTNTKGFCNDAIEKLAKDLSGGSYLMLWSKPMKPGGRPIIDIGYNYNARKVQSLLLQTIQGSHRQVLTIYKSILTSLLMFPFAFFLVPLSCISSLEQLMRLTPTKTKAV